MGTDGKTASVKRKIFAPLVTPSRRTYATPWPAGPSEAYRLSGCYGGKNCKCEEILASIHRSTRSNDMPRTDPPAMELRTPYPDSAHTPRRRADTGYRSMVLHGADMVQQTHGGCPTPRQPNGANLDLLCSNANYAGYMYVETPAHPPWVC
jgi:hypothetical protein